MLPLLKIAFYVPLIINGLISLFYFGATFLSMLFPPNPTYKGADGLWLLAGTAVILFLLWYARKLAIDDQQAGLGFLVLIGSYLAWAVVLITGFLFSGSQNWK